MHYITVHLLHHKIPHSLSQIAFAAEQTAPFLSLINTPFLLKSQSSSMHQ